MIRPLRIQSPVARHDARIPLGRKVLSSALLALAALLVPAPVAHGAVEKIIAPVPPSIQAFQPGEALTYDISWSNIVTAGTAVMEVKEETLPDGRQVLKFLVTGRSAGLVDKFFPVHDTVESIFDPSLRQSLSYSLQESFGKKKRRRDMIFDHVQNTVVSTLNNDPSETLSVPAGVQDGLSTLYYLRTMEDFTVGKVVTIDVLDSGKNWSVEVHTLGRETIKTPAGEFAAIKVKTYPKYEGVFLNKGEVFIWLTDDSRKVPLLMKSTLKFGSFVFTLMELKPGAGAH
jgi:uncharacterized protein DUF3108